MDLKKKCFICLLLLVSLCIVTAIPQDNKQISIDFTYPQSSIIEGANYSINVNNTNCWQGICVNPESAYAKYQFSSNNFNGSGDFVTTGNILSSFIQSGYFIGEDFYTDYLSDIGIGMKDNTLYSNMDILIAPGNHNSFIMRFDTEELDMTFRPGSITDSTGTIDFDNEHLTTTGNITAGKFIGNGSLLTGITGGNSSFNQSLTDSLYSKYQFSSNNFNGSGNFSTSGEITTPRINSINRTRPIAINPNGVGDGTVTGSFAKSGIGAKFFENATYYSGTHGATTNHNPALAIYGGSSAGQKVWYKGVDDWGRGYNGGTISSMVYDIPLVPSTELQLGATISGFLYKNTAFSSPTYRYHTTFGGSNDSYDRPLWVLTTDTRKNMDFLTANVSSPEMWFHDGNTTAGNHVKIYHKNLNGNVISNTGHLNLSGKTGVDIYADGSKIIDVATDGKVGIGRTPTTYDLEVQGTISPTVGIQIGSLEISQNSIYGVDTSAEFWEVWTGEIYATDIYADNYYTNSYVADVQGSALSQLDNFPEWKYPNGSINYKNHYAYHEGIKEIKNKDGTKETIKIDALSVEKRIAELEKMVYELREDNKLIKSEICTIKLFSWCAIK